MQRAKQSAKCVFDFRLISAEFQAIIEFSTKKRQVASCLAMTTAYAWQIASLVALARNDTVVLKNIRKLLSR